GIGVGDWLPGKQILLEIELDRRQQCYAVRRQRRRRLRGRTGGGDQPQREGCCHTSSRSRRQLGALPGRLPVGIPLRLRPSYRNNDVLGFRVARSQSGQELSSSSSVVGARGA
ncbi:MAG: hypothetical protein NTY25_03330, partial [Planctomycetia bacterium]|nr:hypothetical protein [Planctomycetia bacterium]